jgi:pimeloyl-ACP methyl ester carboxylesterase
VRIWTAASQAALFVKALHHLGVREPVVLGHSWGALVAIAIGLQDTYPVRGLVLASVRTIRYPFHRRVLW